MQRYLTFSEQPLYPVAQYFITRDLKAAGGGNVPLEQPWYQVLPPRLDWKISPC